MKLKKSILATILVTTTLTLPTSATAATFVTITDLANKLNIAPSTYNVRLKDTTDKRMVTMYDYGMIRIVNGCAEPDRTLTNGEIVSALVSYYDAINNTDLSLETKAPYVYQTDINLTITDIDNILANIEETYKSKSEMENTEDKNNIIIKW